MIKAIVQQQLLSHYCQTGKKIVKNGKLNLFGKGIMVLDSVGMQTEQLQNIFEIDLSHNSISRLDNLSQFTNVEVISIAHNNISDFAELDKLACLKRLNKILVKKNPFLKESIPFSSVQFMFSLETDILFANQQLQRQIGEIVGQVVQFKCFQNYLKKVEMHIELMNKNKMCESFLNPSISMFPKIKKILQQWYEREIRVRRQFVAKIDKEYFKDQKKLEAYLQKQIERGKQRKSAIVKQIYESQEILKEQRANYQSKRKCRQLQERKNNLSEINNSKQGRKSLNQKMNNVVRNLKKSKYTSSQNGQGIMSDFAEIKNCEQIDQQFLNILGKINPLYSLLRSPLGSLKSHQKELLIENLVNLLKEKVKQLFRYQLLQKQHQALKNQFVSLQEHLEWITSEIKKEQSLAAQKIKSLSSQCEQESGRVETLRQQLVKCRQELSLLKQSSSEQAKQNQKKQKELLQVQLQDKNDLIIQNRREEKIKAKYLGYLCKKAGHLNKLKLLRGINEKLQSNELKSNVFNQFRLNRDLCKKQKLLMRHLTRKLQKELLSQLQSEHYNFQKGRQLQRRFSSRRTLLFFRIFKGLFQKWQKQSAKIRIALKKREGRIKSHCFNCFKAVLSDKHDQQTNQFLMKFSFKLMKAKYFRMWIKYCSQHEKTGQVLKSSLTEKNKRKALTLFEDNCQKLLDYRIHTQALEQFLKKIRKINSYSNFAKSIESVLLKREIKGNKIRMLKQYHYFQQFVSASRDKLLRKRLARQQRKKKQELQMQQAKEFQQKIHQRKKVLLKNMKVIILKIGNQIKVKMMYRSSKQIWLQKSNNQKNMKQFYCKFRSGFAKNLAYKLKMKLLKASNVMMAPVRQVFSNLSKNLLIIKQKQKNYLKKLKAKSFYRWKGFTYFCRMQNYRLRFEDLEPQIFRVTELQRELREEKLMLLEQLQTKQQEIEQYVKKCQEYEVVLHSKELKYEKLKDIYAETVQVYDLNNTIKACDYAQNRSASYRQNEEDIYIKYLPTEVKGKNGLYSDQKIKTESENILINEAKTPSSKYFQANRPAYDYFNEETYLKKPRESNNAFISSFRRF